eukprot:4574484-Heterocapsa_arctica.AAC.1
MLKPGFGTKAAPEAWGLELMKSLIKVKWYPTKADNLKQPVGILTTHVDDLKKGSDEQVRKELFKTLEARVWRADGGPTTVRVHRDPAHLGPRHYGHRYGPKPLRSPASPNRLPRAEEHEERGVARHQVPGR